jgi:hypothetical protein
MKDNFDLKKFLKESKAIENLNPSLKTINEKEDKSSKEAPLKSKIREMIIDELSEADEITQASNDDYNPTYESKSEELHKEDKLTPEERKLMDDIGKSFVDNLKAVKAREKAEREKLSQTNKKHEIKEIDTKKLDDKIQKDPKLLKRVKDATEKAEKGDTTDLAMLMAMTLEETNLEEANAGYTAAKKAMNSLSDEDKEDFIDYVTSKAKFMKYKNADLKEAKKDEDGEEMEDESREERADVDKFEFEKGKEAGEEEGEGGIEAIAADLDGTEKDLMGNLMNALKIAKGMDNEKLEVQIGNTLKFFVSTYIDKEENER